MESEEGTAPPPDESTTTTVVVRRRFRWLRTILLAIIALAAFLAIGVIVLNSAIGHRFVVSRIANIAPASGLRIKIGRIDGSLYGAATLRDVTLSDPQGPFVRIPMVELDWRPTHWFSSGLDVRKLVTHQGTLLRVPHFRPGNPNAPTLPNFDIRIDRFQIDAMTVAAGVLGSRRRADFLAKVDIRKGRAYVRAQGGVSGGDLVYALLDTEPDRDKFDLHLDVNAPKGGLLASMSGIQQDLRIRAAGKGGWRRWDGGLLVDRSGTRLAALQVTNRKGLYSALGQAWPGGLLQGTAARAVGPVLAIGADGTLTNSVLKGSIGARGAAFRLLGGGVVDLANNAFHRVAATIDLTDPQLLGPSVRIDGARLTLLLDGKFRNFTAEQTVIAQRLASGSMRLERVAEHGVATYDGARWTLPVDLAAARAVSGNATVDPRLVDAHARGTFVLAGDRLTSDDLTVAVPGLGARLALRGDFAKGTYAVAGPVVARGWRLPNLGLVDADAKIVATFGAVPWKVSADLSGRMARVENATLTSLAGQNIRFAGAVSTGAAQPLLFQRARLVGTKLDLALSGRVLPDGRTTLAGSGRHADYGAFTIEATMAQDGPHAELVFADPYPAAQLSNVRVALAPIPDGFRIETAGGSMLGPFAGTLGLYMRPGGPTRVQIQHLVVSNTAVTGALVLGGSAVTGDLALSGGGVSGTVHLSPRGGGQAFAVALTADNARFGGATPLTIAAGRLDASGLLVGGHSTITGSLQGQGIGSGSLFIGRVAANASLQDGRGRILASLAGRRGSRFNLQLLGDVAPKRIAVLAQGDFAGRKIVMPRRAVLTEEAGGWRLAPTQIDFAGGRIIGQGLFGSRATELNLALADMPLSVADIVVSELGVGGRASGLISYRAPHGGIPTGDVRLMIRGLTRSGLVLTSRPIDLALVGQLGARELQMRAVASEGGQVRGRLQARVGGLPPGGTLIERLSAGSLFAQLRYDGPADALWRLAAIEAFDLTGPISVAADLTGSMANPQIRGSAASTALRLQSALTGTDLSQVSLRGNFAGSRLDIPTLTGRTPNGGTVVGSGTVNLSGIGTKGPQLDLKLAAHNAQILNR
ncbi:MAG: translocation/assembly module TamB, partial [Novosphingobium sp.]|nr:translocation/assembly module TamB [Novosphingobium sp.]